MPLKVQGTLKNRWLLFSCCCTCPLFSFTSSFHDFLENEAFLIFLLPAFCRFLFFNVFLKYWCLPGFCPRPLVIFLYISSSRSSLLTPWRHLPCVFTMLFSVSSPDDSWALDRNFQLLPRHLHMGVCSHVFFGTELLAFCLISFSRFLCQVNGTTG